MTGVTTMRRPAVTAVQTLPPRVSDAGVVPATCCVTGETRVTR